MKFGPTTNFLIRVRNELVDADFAEVVVDAPSDKLPQGMSDKFRLGPLVSISGGDPPQSGPCDPQSPHGFLGKDAPVAQAMKSWMLGRDFPREIR